MILISSAKIDNLAQIFQILSETNRLKILFALQDDSRSVSEITKLTNLSQPLVSFHLNALREAGLVEKYRKSTFVFNKLSDPKLIDLIKQFNQYNIENCPKEKSSFPCPPWQD
ncbi:MAG: metalloregulator ArsR/SmtB family transcription factor [Halanaerobacter sp.]